MQHLLKPGVQVHLTCANGCYYLTVAWAPSGPTRTIPPGIVPGIYFGTSIEEVVNLAVGVEEG